MASSLCACPALFFKMIILCVCSELLQRPFPALAERLAPVSLRGAPDSLPGPAVPPPPPGTQRPPPPTHSHGHTSRSRCALPAPLPFLLSFSSLRTRSAESSHHRRFRTAIRREIWANSASPWTLLSSGFAILRSTECTNLRFIRRGPVWSGEKFNPLRHLCPAHCAPPHPHPPQGTYREPFLWRFGLFPVPWGRREGAAERFFSGKHAPRGRKLSWGRCSGQLAAALCRAGAGRK